MAEPVFIGIDLGTTNGKVAAYGLTGGLLAEASYSYPTHFPRPGWVEQDPRDWRVALELGMREVAAGLGDRAPDVAGLAISNFGPGLVMMDRAGDPLAPCPTWQDERSWEYGRRLVAEVGTNWIGLGPPLASFPAKLLCALEEVPELVARADQVTDIKGFLMRWLTGRVITDPSSGPGANAWWAPVFEAIGWAIEQLPPVMPPTASPGGLREDLARRVGLKPGIPVFAGINDGAAATVGSGAVALGDSVITLATNGACRLVLPERLDPEIVLARHLFSWPLVEEMWVCGGFTCSGAGSLQWLADLFGLPRDPQAYTVLLEQAAQVPPGSRGILFLPYLAGRGSPSADPELRGGFVHVGLDHGRAELARAVLEGIAFALREIYEEFSRLNLQFGAIRITGGGARSELWRQIVADVLERPVSRAGGDSTLGDAMVAAVGLRCYPDFATASAAMVKTTARAEPTSEEAATYRRVFRVFTQARDVLQSAPRLA
jgi:xylulokinase